MQSLPFIHRLNWNQILLLNCVTLGLTTFLHSPGTPMRTELSRCEKDLPVRLARRLSLPHSNVSTSKGRDDPEMVFSLEIVIE